MLRRPQRAALGPSFQPCRRFGSVGATPRRLGRFSKDEARGFERRTVPVPGAVGARIAEDPFGVHEYVRLHAQNFDEALRRLRAGVVETGKFSMASDLFPSGPHLLAGVERASQRRVANGVPCLRDPPPNELRCDQAMAAFLGRPPIALGDGRTVDLRANLEALLQATSDQFDQGMSAKLLFGYHASTKVAMSVVALLPAAAPAAQRGRVELEWAGDTSRSTVPGRRAEWVPDDAKGCYGATDEHWTRWVLPPEGAPVVYRLCRKLRDDVSAFDTACWRG